MRHLVTRIMLSFCLITVLYWSGHQPVAAQNTGAEDIVVIANRDVSITRLDRDSLRAIFAMRQRTWPDGQAVHVFVLPNDSDVHAAFAKERLAVFPHQLQLAWDRMVFSGTGQAPHRIRTQQEMLEAIASTAGSIGYIAREYLDERVQVITRE